MWFGIAYVIRNVDESDRNCLRGKYLVHAVKLNMSTFRLVQVCNPHCNWKPDVLICMCLWCCRRHRRRIHDELKHRTPHAGSWKNMHAETGDYRIFEVTHNAHAYVQTFCRCFKRELRLPRTQGCYKLSLNNSSRSFAWQITKPITLWNSECNRASVKTIITSLSSIDEHWHEERHAL